MAKYYRTPELVNYANKTDTLHIESDVFQLGLVLTELFTGQNPLVPVDNLRAPIQLDRIGRIEDENSGMGGAVFNTLRQMLEQDYRKRISISLALDRFSGLYQEL